MTEIVVFGATGQVGREVVRELVALGVRPRVYSQSREKAEGHFGDSVAVVEGDFDDHAALERALRDVESVFLMSPMDPRQVTWQGAVIEAAAGSRPLIVKLSGLATLPGSYVDSGRWHAESEAKIRALDLPHVFLHPNFFMQNLARSVPGALDRGVLVASASDARIAPVDVRDIGAVAARLLTGQVDRTGATLRLTDTEAFTYESLAAELGELAGRTIEVVEMSEGQTRAALANTGMPDWHIDILLQFNRAFREGLGATTSRDVAEVLDGPPRSVHTYLREQVLKHRESARSGEPRGSER
jgi:uncharacterized protein YbjT (DUF2867 family)